MSFRFLNPRMVDEDPEFLDDVCYKSIGDDAPEILCNEIPPNQLRFLGWWYLTPERHFLEWVGFVSIGTILVSLLRHKMLPPKSLDHTSKATKQQALTPRLWMQLSTLFFYPYVAYTKLSWKGSYYPGRWLLFVGMPVGTLWLFSVFFCCFDILWSGRWHNNNTTLRVVYRIRYWWLEIWLSFLPLVKDMLPGLFVDALYSIKQYLHHHKISSGHDGENANIAYFCHCLYLVLAPSYYYLWTGELSDQLSSATTDNNTRSNSTEMTVSNLQRLATESVTKQTIGTAICVIYYMGIVTPASIVAGLNVNFLLVAVYGEGKNFRIYLVVQWFLQGCVFRCFLGVAKLLIKEAGRTTRAALRDFVGDEENQSMNYKDR